MDNKIRSHFFTPDIDSLNISDWQNPTIEDYWIIQDFFKQKLKALVDAPMSARPFHNDYLNTDFYGWLTYRMARIKLIKNETESPSFNIQYFNNDPNNKEQCVICYAGYPSPGSDQRDYALGINYIAESLKKFGFNGHFIYRIGGWPNLKKRPT